VVCLSGETADTLRALEYAQVRLDCKGILLQEYAQVRLAVCKQMNGPHDLHRVTAEVLDGGLCASRKLSQFSSCYVVDPGCSGIRSCSPCPYHTGLGCVSSCVGVHDHQRCELHVFKTMELLLRVF
jgi:hypothetical protein